MISLGEAQARLFALRGPVEVEEVALVEAIGRWASEDVCAKRTQPACDLSAMDGYAVRHSDSPGPWQLIGESAAGRPFAGMIGKRETVRIFTGAIVPDGADAILIQEDAACVSNRVSINGTAPGAGEHIRRAGSDFAIGNVLARAGERWTAARIGLAAMGGYAAVPVRRRLRIAIISTGDELVQPGAPCSDAQIPSSNAPMLAAMLASWPVQIEDRGIVRDDLGALIDAFAACAGADVILSIGGASVGDHDLVQPALVAAGAKLDFWKIAMRPGKPVMAGMIGNSVVIGLPGNPVSAFVTAALLLLPLVAHLGGAAQPLPQRIEARLGMPLPANGTRLDHIRAEIKDGVATPVGFNDSSMLRALSQSNALIIREINARPCDSGETVQCLLLE